MSIDSQMIHIAQILLSTAASFLLIQVFIRIGIIANSSTHQSRINAMLRQVWIGSVSFSICVGALVGVSL